MVDGTAHITGPLPSREWKQQALTTIHQYSGLKRKPSNKIDNPDPITHLASEDIHPHTRDQISGRGGNCLFAALSKELTGTERNHRAVRLAIANFMAQHPELHEVLGVGSIQSYLSQSRMHNLGTWGTDVEILAAATMLNMEVVVSSRLHDQPHSLTPYNPIHVLYFQTSTGRQRVSSQQQQDPSRVKVYLYHTDARNHYDRLVLALH